MWLALGRAGEREGGGGGRETFKVACSLEINFKPGPSEDETKVNVGRHHQASSTGRSGGEATLIIHHLQKGKYYIIHPYSNIIMTVCTINHNYLF